MPNIDVSSNRAAEKYSWEEQCLRVIWAFAYPFFRFSPRPMFAWRAFLLRLFGATVGKKVHICPSARVYFPWMLEIGDFSSVDEECFIYNLGLLKIGQRVTISRAAFLCGGTHDDNDPCMKLVRSRITIEDDCWICARAFIGPAVIVRKQVIVGACAVVMHDVEPGKVVAGNPARTIRDRNGTIEIEKPKSSLETTSSIQVHPK